MNWEIMSDKDARKWFKEHPGYTAQQRVKGGPWKAGRVMFGCLSIMGSGSTLAEATVKMLESIKSGRKF